MSSLFLADLFTDRLVDKRPLFPGGSTPITGFYGVQVPDAVNVGTPPDVATLVSSKYAGLQSFYGFLPNIAYDAQFSNVDSGNSTSIQIAPKVGVSLIPPNSGNAVLQSAAVTLGSTPTQAVLVYEAFYYLDSDVSAGRFTRSYALPAPGDADAVVSVAVSFDGLATHFNITPSSIFSIPTASQGNSFVVRFVRTGGTKRLFIGSWAVLYL